MINMNLQMDICEMMFDYKIPNIPLIILLGKLVNNSTVIQEGGYTDLSVWVMVGYSGLKLLLFCQTSFDKLIILSMATRQA